MEILSNVQPGTKNINTMIKYALVGCTLCITSEEYFRIWNWIQKLGGTMVTDKLN